VFTFIESAAFERVRALYLPDDEYVELQHFLMENPEAGSVVPGSALDAHPLCQGQAR
jgi:hypothetical protein